MFVFFLLLKCNKRAKYIEIELILCLFSNDVNIIEIQFIFDWFADFSYRVIAGELLSSSYYLTGMPVNFDILNKINSQVTSQIEMTFFLCIISDKNSDKKMRRRLFLLENNQKINFTLTLKIA